jgi:DnaJ-class molecular chaperone
MKDLYAILGVPENADADAIKKAYRKLAKQNHPDATGGDKKKTERFKDVGDAYEVLSDAKKRSEYDRLRQAPVGADGMPQGFDADTFSQIFGDYRTGGQGGGRGTAGGFGDFGDLFSTLFGGGGPAGQPGARGRGRGSDMQGAVEVSFREAALGTRRSLRAGSGQNVEVNVPAGVESGARLRVPGQGGPAPRHGRPGDLFLDITVLPDPHLRRSGRDIELTLPLTWAEACLGTQVDVPTLDGSVRLTIPAGTSSGAKLRLRGKGVKGADGTRGDQFCRIEVIVPKLDPDDKELRGLVEELDRRAKTVKPRSF